MQEKAEDARLKEALGDDFEGYMKFKAAQDTREKKAKAREIAGKLIGDGGKYFTDYSRLDAQLNAIWEKAMKEANAQVGIIEEEPKD